MVNYQYAYQCNMYMEIDNGTNGTCTSFNMVLQVNDAAKYGKCTSFIW